MVKTEERREETEEEETEMKDCGKENRKEEKNFIGLCGLAQKHYNH